MTQLFDLERGTMPKLKGAPKWFVKLAQTCPPMIGSVPDWTCMETRKRFHELRYSSMMLGLVPYNAQKYLLALAADPACSLLIIHIGRQQGKTATELTLLVSRCLSHANETAVFSMQNGTEADTKLKKELVPMMAYAGLGEEAGATFNASNSSAFGQYFDNASHIRTLSSDRHAGRGETRVGLAVVDEASTDKDSNRLALITPMQTVTEHSDSQMIISGTAGDITSTMFESQIAQAVAAARKGSREIKIAYWGLGLPGDAPPDVDYESEEVHRSVLPGIGYICTPSAIRAAMHRMEDWQFQQEYLGIWLQIRSDQCFHRLTWKRVQSENMDMDLDGPLWLAIDCPPTDDNPCAVVCDSEGVLSVTEACDTQADVDDYVRDVCERRDVQSVGFTKGGVLEKTAMRLEADGLPVRWYDLREHARACQTLWAALNSNPRRAALVPDPKFDEANDSSMRRELSGGGWIFRRRTATGYASPLLSAAMAYFDHDDAVTTSTPDWANEWEQAKADAAEAAGSGVLDEWEQALAEARGQ